MSPELPIASTATQKLDQPVKAAVTSIDRKEVKAVPLVRPTVINAAKTSRQETADGDLLIARFLRTMQVQLRSMGLYERNHPRLIDNLELAERDLRAVFARYPGFGIRVDDGAFYLTTRLAEMPLAARYGSRGPGNLRPQLPQVPSRARTRDGRALVDKRGDLRTSPKNSTTPESNRWFSYRKPTWGELASLVHTLDATGRARKLAHGGIIFVEPDWPTWVAAHGLAGIRVNSPLGPGHDAVLASCWERMLSRGKRQSCRKRNS